MIVKKHRTAGGILVAICDENIFGKKFSEDGKMLDLSADFYKGEKMDGETALRVCKSAYIINSVGEKSVALLTKNKFVSEKNIIKIKGIPFAQCIVLENEI